MGIQLKRIFDWVEQRQGLVGLMRLEVKIALSRERAMDGDDLPHVLEAARAAAREITGEDPPSP